MEKQPICPYCNNEFDIDKNEAYFLYAEDDFHELQCGNCEEEFWVRTNVTYTFTSEKNVDDL